MVTVIFFYPSTSIQSALNQVVFLFESLSPFRCMVIRFACFRSGRLMGPLETENCCDRWLLYGRIFKALFIYDLTTFFFTTCGSSIVYGLEKAIEESLLFDESGCFRHCCSVSFCLSSAMLLLGLAHHAPFLCD